ncbi:MAG: PIN domain-containing protein [Bryobacterales bacterium]|nr:PIN domain-containing protein [Bryobacterales bacterium]
MPGYFLDTSAFAKLYHQEAGSQYVERLVEQKGSTAVVSRLSLVEIESVIAIKVRIGELDAAGQHLSRRRLLADISQGRVRIGPSIDERHYQIARRLLVRYGVAMALRTLDAVQLAVALDLQQAGLISVIVAADKRLCRVAEECACPTIDPGDPRVTTP